MYPLIASGDHDGVTISLGVYGERTCKTGFGDSAAMWLFVPASSIVQYGILLNKFI